MNKFTIPLIICLALVSPEAQAEVVSSSDTHFVLRHEALSTRNPEALWARLVRPASWWHPDHTYSGDARNLTLNLAAGGLWAENWEGGSVAHGTVVYVRHGEMLRMMAPFGPLQEVGAYTIWTVTIAAHGDGSKVIFDEVSSAPPSAGLAELAAAVDYVKTEAIARLVAD